MIEFQRCLVEYDDNNISVRRQCELLGINRSSLYYTPTPETEENLAIMKMIDKKYMDTPYFGSRRMSAWLNRQDGYFTNRKRIQRLMRTMRLEAIYPKPNTSKPNMEHKIYPYLLRDVEIKHPNHVWSTDITYIPMKGGFMYLVAIMDWFSRYVLSWEISNTLDADFCIVALKKALKKSTPKIFNSDQGSQFTSSSYTSVLRDAGISISMDGKGRAFDNIFIERLWRSLKYDDIYIKDYADGYELIEGVGRYFKLHNYDKPHQSLGYLVPAEVYHVRL